MGGAIDRRSCAAPVMLRVALVLVGTTAYLGLAVLGGGGLAAFFSHPARVALAVVVLVLAGASLFTAGNLSAGVREDRGNRWVLVAFALIGMLAAYLPAYADRTDSWTFDGDTVCWLGVVLFAAGGALWIWPVFTLGRRFSGLVPRQHTGQVERGRQPGNGRLCGRAPSGLAPVASELQPRACISKRK